MGTIPFGTNSFNDITATSNLVYWYSMRSVGPTGEGACSVENDTGNMLLPPPATVSATDGTFTDKVRVTWIPPSVGIPAASFRLHRTTNSQAPGCSSLLQSDIPNTQPLQSDDFAVQLGTVYYYSIESVFPSGASNCSNIDPGYPLTVCSDGLDNDGDWGSNTLLTIPVLHSLITTKKITPAPTSVTTGLITTATEELIMSLPAVAIQVVRAHATPVKMIQQRDLRVRHLLSSIRSSDNKITPS